jgi:hypothetical protein
VVLDGLKLMSSLDKLSDEERRAIIAEVERQRGK